ncbi:hypothetical protein [Actinacidiphila bryophytorum]|nr:hypothetical protein [Actinacidiphila bryophytorum]UWE12409.1 hypothetical protein NYE86_29475 [Actinacidiphila bryophytorum]
MINGFPALWARDIAIGRPRGVGAFTDTGAMWPNTTWLTIKLAT